MKKLFTHLYDSFINLLGMTLVERIPMMTDKEHEKMGRCSCCSKRLKPENVGFQVILGIGSKLELDTDDECWDTFKELYLNLNDLQLDHVREGKRAKR